MNHLIEGDELRLHPGFRFHPTDRELITHYLLPKALDPRFASLAIGDADLLKLEPWELPWMAKIGEEEWYFFSLREKRYSSGQRTNRATNSGYWKATGKDKEIYGGKSENGLVGMRKTLVFYQGRAPKGAKSNWVMHEFRLDGEYSIDRLPQSAQSGWVISRVFKKDSSGKRTHISELRRQEETPPPPLVDSSPRSCSGGATNSAFPYYSDDHLQLSDCFDDDQSVLKLLLDGDGSDAFALDTGPIYDFSSSIGINPPFNY